MPHVLRWLLGLATSLIGNHIYPGHARLGRGADDYASQRRVDPGGRGHPAGRAAARRRGFRRSDRAEADHHRLRRTADLDYGRIRDRRSRRRGQAAAARCAGGAVRGGGRLLLCPPSTAPPGIWSGENDHSTRRREDHSGAWRRVRRRTSGQLAACRGQRRSGVLGERLVVRGLGRPLGRDANGHPEEDPPGQDVPDAERNSACRCGRI